MNVTYEYSSVFTALCFAIIALMTTYYFIKPRRIVFPYLITLLVFTGTQYGLSEQGTTTIFTRGIGVLSIPLINVFIYILFAYVFFRYGTRYKKINEPVVMNGSLLFLIAIVILYYLYGIVTGETFENMVSHRGMINIVNLYVCYLMMKWWIYDERQLESFVKVFIYATSFMAVYGLIRWGLFGGDPANYYANFEGQSVKITYFDSGQGVLFGVLFVLLYNKTRGTLVRGITLWFYYFMMGLCMLNILLSYRRTVWVGMSLLFVWIFFTSTVSRKVLILGVAFVALAIGSGIYQKRYVASHSTQSIVSDITDKSGKVDLKHGRFSELVNALEVANQYWMTGLGPWGINTPRVTPLKETDFVHSSILHVYIKTGIIGMVMYLAVFVGYVTWWIRRRNQLWKNNYYRSIGDAFFCGFLIEVTDIIFGTPLIIFRHSQILAILLVIPYVCYRLDKITVERSAVQKKQQKRLLLSR